MTARVLETVLTARNLLSPELARASRDVIAFNNTVSAAQAKTNAAATSGAATQDRAADKIARSNVKASTSATASTQAQVRAHSTAAQSATVASRTQQAANTALIRSNGMLGGSLTPLTAGLGGTALALGYAGYRGMEFGSAMSQVAAASQETGATLGDLGAAAAEAGAKTQYSAVEAAQGITAMSKAGVGAKDILGGGLTGALNLAASGELAVADAAEIAATAMTQFKLSGADLPHVADLLAAGAGKAQGSVHDLGMALNQAGLVSAAAGLSIEETTGSLAAFASAGLIGSDAGTSFRSMLQHLQNPSKQAAEEMDRLGINMYDANGAFVGMESLAGQLQTRMGGLTQAQRDQAMAVIFGSDAVRAANVLYTQGQPGIARWTKAVDDAGFASRQAAALTDNLAGDLERARGALDSLFTTVGAGAQGPLRELVQGFTAVVNAGGDVVGFLSDLPGPAKATLAALVAIHLANGPLSGTLATVGTQLSTLTARAGGAAASLMTLRGAGAGALAAFGGPWGVAIATVGGLATAMELLSPPIEITQASVAKLNRSLQEFGRTGSVSGELSRMFGDVDGVIEDLNTVGPAISGFVDDLLYQLELIDEQGQIDLGRWFEYNGGNPSANLARMRADFDQARQNVEDLDGTLAAMVANGQAEAAAKATMRLYDAWVQSGGEIGEFRRKFPEVTDAMEAYSLTSDTVVTDTGAITTGLGEAKSAADLLRTAFDQLNGIYITAADANIAWTQAMDDLKIAAENGRTTLDLNTISGADNAAQFTAAALQARDWAAAVGDTSGPEAGRAKLAELRQALIDNAVSTGFNRDEVSRLIDELFRVPESVETAANLQDNATPGLAVVNQALDYTDGRSATVYVKTVTTEVVNRILNAVPHSEAGSGGNPIGLPPVPRRASGGPVWPGQTFLVGEKGPELVRFNTAGAVIPAGATAAMLARQVSQTAAAQLAVQATATGSPGLWSGSAAAASPAAMPGYAATLAPAAMPGYGAVGGGGGPITISVAAAPVRIYLDGKEWRGMARVEAETVVYTHEHTKARNARGWQ